MLLFLLLHPAVHGQEITPDSTSHDHYPDTAATDIPSDTLESDLFIQGHNIASEEVIVVEKSIMQREHSPTKAAIFSAVVPGLGQAYNRKYWKIPIVYAGLGVSVYFLQDNIRQINHFKQQYRNAIDDDPNTHNTSGYNTTTLQDLITQHRKWRDYSYLGLIAVYVLNIVDASVDAHLFYFDVSPDLSLGIYPSIQGATQPNPGLTLCLKL